MPIEDADPRIDFGVRIPMRDGLCLSATVYRLDGPPHPSPAVFTLTPYVGQIFHEQAVRFAECGYPFLTVDVRGRGDSDGDFRPFRDVGKDGFDVVEWIARQPYCNGQVAMWGGSYGGFSQWAVAAEQPPHLSTIVPVASSCLGVDMPMRGNISFSYLPRWLALVSGRASQEKIFSDHSFWRRQLAKWFRSGSAFRELDSFLGFPSASFQEWMGHPCCDAYWDDYNPKPDQYARIANPILTITGMYDGDQPGALAHYYRHRRENSNSSSLQHFLVIGPWDHAGTRVPRQEFAGIKVGPKSIIDLLQLHCQWYEWIMQGGPRPMFLKDKVAYYVLGAEEWRYAPTLEEVTTGIHESFLDSSGGLAGVFNSGALEKAPCRDDYNEYKFDPLDISPLRWESEDGPLCLRPTFPVDDVTDQRAVLASDGKQAVYHSIPLERDLEVAGFFMLSIWISIDCPDTDLQAAVYNIGRDGRSLLLSSDSIRARYRDSLREEKLVPSIEPICYEFRRFTFAACRLRRGSRLRLVIGAVNSIHTQKNYNSGGSVADETSNDARTVTVRILHGPSHPSVLRVPIGERELNHG